MQVTPFKTAAGLNSLRLVPPIHFVALFFFFFTATQANPIRATSDGLVLKGAVVATQFWAPKPYTVNLDLEAYHTDLESLIILKNPGVSLVVYGSGRTITYWSTGRMDNFGALDHAVSQKRADRILGQLFPSGALSNIITNTRDTKYWSLIGKLGDQTSGTETYEAKEKSSFGPDCISLNAILSRRSNKFVEFSMVNVCRSTSSGSVLENHPSVLQTFTYGSSKYSSIPTTMDGRFWYGPNYKAYDILSSTTITGNFDPNDMPSLIARHTKGLTINRWPTTYFLGQDSVFSSRWAVLGTGLGILLLLGGAGFLWARAGRERHSSGVSLS